LRQNFGIGLLPKGINPCSEVSLGHKRIIWKSYEPQNSSMETYLESRYVKQYRKRKKTFVAYMAKNVKQTNFMWAITNSLEPD
jgi:hypothetical protein